MKLRRDTAGQVAGGLRERLRERRVRRVERARAEADARRAWERSGEIGKHGAHEGWSSGAGPGG